MDQVLLGEEEKKGTTEKRRIYFGLRQSSEIQVGSMWGRGSTHADVGSVGLTLRNSLLPLGLSYCVF